MNESKRQSIRTTLSKTKERRKDLVCKVISCKIDSSHSSKKKSDFMFGIFRESKWLYNDQLSTEDIFNYDTKRTEVSVLNKDKVKEVRPFQYISSQMKQSVSDKLKQNVVNLSKAKKSGRQVGRLKFKSEINSIPLKQPGVTFEIVGKNRVRIQGFKGTFRVSGLKQIPKNADIAKAELIKEGFDFYIKFTIFVPREDRPATGRSVGIDFGISDNLVTSDNEKFNIKIPETSRLKKLSRGMNRKKKGSRNRYFQRIRLQSEYGNIKNRKTDLKNKFVSYLVNTYDTVVCQDENLEGWHRGLFRRGVQYSCMGEIILDLKRKSKTFIEVDRFFPSTQLCDECGNRENVKLSDRIFHCKKCGNTKDRDLHSALNIKHKGLNISPFRSTKDFNTPVEQVALPTLATACEMHWIKPVKDTGSLSLQA